MDSKTHAAYGTVVASRVRSRHDVLIVWFFPAWLFQRGAAEGPELLLRKLRGEHIDWDALREARWPKARCQRCLELKSLDLFAHAQWEKIRANLEATCLACQRQNKDGKGPLKRSFKRPDRRAEEHRVQQLAQKNADKKRQCSACRRALSELTCTVCRTRKPAGEFAPSMCTMPDNALACLACQQGMRGKAKRLRAGWFFCTPRQPQATPPGNTASTAPCAQPGKWAGRPASIASATSASRARKEDCARTAQIEHDRRCAGERSNSERPRNIMYSSNCIDPMGNAAVSRQPQAVPGAPYIIEASSRSEKIGQHARQR